MIPILRRLVRSAQNRWRSGAFLFPGALTALLVAIAVVLLANVHSGHNWNGDFAQYLMHAQNIVDGQPYAKTPYVRGPINSNPGPPAYPPGFPLLLAPVYAAFGTAIIPMKVLIIVTFVGALGLVASLLKEEFPTPYILALIAVLGFNPFLVHFTTSVVSDLPFLLFVMLSLVAWQQSRAQPETKTKIALAGLSGLLIYFSVLIRALGVVLPVSLLIYELLDRGRLSRTALIGLSTVGLAFGLQTVASMISAGTTTSTGIGHYEALVRQNLLNRFSELAGSALHSARVYGRRMAQVVWRPLTPFLGYDIGLLRILTLLLVVGGWLYHALFRLSSFDVFTPLYVAALLPWSFHWTRYLIPVLPFCAFYVLYALYGLHRWMQWKRPVLMLCTVAPLLAAYGWSLVHNPATPSPKGALAPEAERVYREVRTETPSDALIVFSKPRFVALKTGRRSVRGFEGWDDDELLDYFMEAGVDYLLMGPPTANRRETIKTFVEDHPSRFASAYQSSQYTLYRFIPRGETAEATLRRKSIHRTATAPGSRVQSPTRSRGRSR